MYNFATEQKAFNLGDVRIGGQPGENSTLLIGTALYGKKYDVLNQDAVDEITSLIEKQRKMEELTGNPGIVDLFIGKKEDAAARIDIVLDSLPRERVFAIDVPESGVRVAALKYLAEQSALDRVIYNSLNMGLTDEEREALKENTPLAAVLLAYNPKDFSTDGRIEILETGAGMLDKGLLSIAEEVGINHLLLDTGATPFDHSAAETLRAIPAMKNKWGWPVGCSIHNTVESWLWMKEYKKEHRDIYKYCDVGSNGLVMLLGGNFLVYGPINNAEIVFPFAAMVDKFVSEGAEEYFGVEPREGHPRRRLP